jgi:hypothetical protein
MVTQTLTAGTVTQTRISGPVPPILISGMDIPTPTRDPALHILRQAPAFRILIPGRVSQSLLRVVTKSLEKKLSKGWKIAIGVVLVVGLALGSGFLLVLNQLKAYHSETWLENKPEFKEEEVIEGAPFSENRPKIISVAAAEKIESEDLAKKEAEVAPTDHLVESLDEPLNIELEAKVIGGDATLYVLSMSEENDLEKTSEDPSEGTMTLLDGQTWSKTVVATNQAQADWQISLEPADPNKNVTLACSITVNGELAPNGWASEQAPVLCDFSVFDLE